MSQVGWVFLDQSGGRHRVGIYHGDRSGHVLIHCNYQVIQVDFSVKDSKTYSFFIGDEFCEVRIFKEKQGFSYEFYVNKKIDTPLNRVRKRHLLRDRKYGILMVLGFAAVVVAGSIGLIRFNRTQVEKRMASTGFSFSLNNDNLQRLMSEGKNAEARIFITPGDVEKVYYRFLTADSTVVSGGMRFPEGALRLLPTGFPLHDGDAFNAFYLPSNPKVFYLNFALPSDLTIAGYLRAAAQAEQQAHREAGEQKAHCLALLTMREKGWEKLGNLIFQEFQPTQNERFNAETYLKMVREPGFAEAVKKECWDQ